MRKSTMTLFTAALALTACSTTKEEDTAETTAAAPAEETTVAEPAATEAVDTTVAATDEWADATVPAETESPAATFPPVVDDRAPGVTDTSIKIGVIYLDLSIAGPVLGINQGDYKAAYQAAFDEVNEAGGIHGRTLEPVFTPIVPASNDQGTAACTELTDDEEVFFVLGNYVDENAPCVVTTHETPLLGGDLAMNPESLAAAKALWFAVGGAAVNRTPACRRSSTRGSSPARSGWSAPSGTSRCTRRTPSRSSKRAGSTSSTSPTSTSSTAPPIPTRCTPLPRPLRSSSSREGIDQVIFNSGGRSGLPERPRPHRLSPATAFDNPPTPPSTSTARATICRSSRTPSPSGLRRRNLFPEMGGATAACVASQETRLGIKILPSTTFPRVSPTTGRAPRWPATSSASSRDPGQGGPGAELGHVHDSRPQPR